jgi:hypothetical protein
MDYPANENQNQPSQRLLAVIGILWLLLAVAIIVSQFSGPTPIKIEWETETEVNTAGFNLYRSTRRDGEFTKINRQLIPSEGSSVSGAAYAYIDRDVVAGQTYYYKLEDVEYDNTAEQHQIVEHAAPLAPWWMLLTAAFSILAGLLLLIKGLR